MSRFYQRYLNSLQGGDKGESSGLLSSENSSKSNNAAIDPTAMVSKTITISSNIDDTKKHNRRVQIVNQSEDISPNDSQKLPVYAKTDTSKEFLKNALKSHYLFETLATEDMGRIVDCMRPTFATVNELIITQGDIGDLFFCIETGNARALVDGHEVMRYGPESCFGELALIYNSPRAASVEAITACKLWALDLKTFRVILATTSSAKMVSRCEFLKKCAFLDPLNNEQIGKLAGALETISYEPNQFIIRQGEAGTSFFIIEDGAVKCTQIKASGREVELLQLKNGEYFGEMALMLNETRHANVIAISQVKCLTLDREKFNLLLGPVQDILAKRMRTRILQSVPLLSKLPEGKLTKLASIMRVQSFANGAYIIKQGDEGSRFYIINEGEVKCTRANAQEQEEELIRLGPNEFFGERALITNEARKANVVAIGNVECLVLERSSFQTLLTEVQDDMLEVMSNRDKKNESAVVEEVIRGPVTNYKYEELKIMRTIGTGTFGRVKMVQHIPSGKVCALKCMNKSEVVASHQERNIMAEKNLLFECSSCPFVLQLLQTYNTKNQIMMLMEFVQGGELWSYIYEKTTLLPRNPSGGFEIPTAKFYAANVILAFSHFDKKKLAYRDLKPENLLMDEQGYIKVIDFGFAKKFPYVKNGNNLDKTYTLCGTPEYLAPEIVMSKGYDKCVDYWALGCFIYELYLSRTPFQADYTTKIFQNIVASEKTLAFPPKIDTLLVTLVKKLLTVNPAFRLGNLSGGVDDIIKDPFFKDVDWDGIYNKTVKSPYKPPIGNALDASNFDAYEEEANVPEYTGPQTHFDGF